MTCIVSHSKATGDSATRGGLTLTLGAIVKPVSSNSLSPYGSGSDAAATFCAYASIAALTTNCPVPPSLTGLQLRSVSFAEPSALFAGQNRSVIGLEPTPLKNENGARLNDVPFGETVETNAIGLGTMQPMRSL